MGVGSWTTLLSGHELEIDEARQDDEVVCLKYHWQRQLGVGSVSFEPSGVRL